MFSVKNLNTIITGGASGIGLEVAKGFSSEGANVILVDIEKPKEDFKYDFLKCDLSSKAQIEKTLIAIDNCNFCPQVLINCAAVTIPGESKNYSDNSWQKSLDINLTSIFILSREIGKRMIINNTKGSIINFTSIGAEQGFANNPGYAATKGGVKQLTKALAVEWGKHGIRVNNIVPGYTRTPMNQKSWNDDELRDDRARHSVFNRWAEPTEMVAPCIFLASNASSYITGSDLIVDGGWLCKGM